MAAPKPAISANLTKLKRLARTNRPIAFKTVGSGTALVYLQGGPNVYLSDGEKLRSWLWENFKLA